MALMENEVDAASSRIHRPQDACCSRGPLYSKVIDRQQQQHSKRQQLQVPDAQVSGPVTLLVSQPCCCCACSCHYQISCCPAGGLSATCSQVPVARTINPPQVQHCPNDHEQGQGHRPPGQTHASFDKLPGVPAPAGLAVSYSNRYRSFHNFSRLTADRDKGLLLSDLEVRNRSRSSIAFPPSHSADFIGDSSLSKRPLRPLGISGRCSRDLSGCGDPIQEDSDEAAQGDSNPASGVVFKHPHVLRHVHTVVPQIRANPLPMCCYSYPEDLPEACSCGYSYSSGCSPLAPAESMSTYQASAISGPQRFSVCMPSSSAGSVCPLSHLGPSNLNTRNQNKPSTLTNLVLSTKLIPDQANGAICQEGHGGNQPKQPDGSCSSSNGDIGTDDSGINSGGGRHHSQPNANFEYLSAEDSNSAPTEPNSPQAISKSSKVGIDQQLVSRTHMSRRPIRKLPALPASRQAHIVQLPSIEGLAASLRGQADRMSARAKEVAGRKYHQPQSSMNPAWTEQMANPEAKSEAPKVTSSNTDAPAVADPKEEAADEALGGWSKYGRLSSFFRSVKFSRIKKATCGSNNSKVSDRNHSKPLQVGPIFGQCLDDLSRQTGQDVPEVLLVCTSFIENLGMVDGVYRVSGVTSNIKRLKAMFDTGTQPACLEKEDWVIRDVHSIPSLIKLFFRELPVSPLQCNVTNNNNCSNNNIRDNQTSALPGEFVNVYQLLKNAAAMGEQNSNKKDCLNEFKATLELLSRPQYCTLKHLMLHLNRVSEKVNDTGMTARNLSIVWAPNLLRTSIGGSSDASHSCHNHSNLRLGPGLNPMVVEERGWGGWRSRNVPVSPDYDQARLHCSLTQNTHVIQCLIENAKWLFADDRQHQKTAMSGHQPLCFPEARIFRKFSENQERNSQQKAKYIVFHNQGHSQKKPKQDQAQKYAETVRFSQPPLQGHNMKQIPLSKRYTSSLSTVGDPRLQDTFYYSANLTNINLPESSSRFHSIQDMGKQLLQRNQRTSVLCRSRGGSSRIFDHCCQADGKLVDLDGLSTRENVLGHVSVSYNPTIQSNQNRVPPLMSNSEGLGGRLSGNGCCADSSVGRFPRHHQLQKRQGRGSDSSRKPRPQSMDAEVLKSLEGNLLLNCSKNAGVNGPRNLLVSTVADHSESTDEDLAGSSDSSLRNNWKICLRQSSSSSDLLNSS